MIYYLTFITTSHVLCATPGFNVTHCRFVNRFNYFSELFDPLNCKITMAFIVHWDTSPGNYNSCGDMFIISPEVFQCNIYNAMSTGFLSLSFSLKCHAGMFV